MRIEHFHSRTKEEAYQRISSLLEKLCEEHRTNISDPTTNWNSDNDRMDFSVKAFSFTLKGTFQILDGKVLIEAKVPFLARPFQNRAEELIRRKLKEIL